MADACYASLVAAARERPPRVALVLGSGLGQVAEAARVVASAPYPDVPGLAAPSVPGHHGRLLLADWAGRRVLIFAGRLHRYEGHPWRAVIEPVHIAHRLGAGSLVLTNAAGGIHEDLAPGTLLLHRDHIDTTQPNWWRGRCGVGGGIDGGIRPGRKSAHSVALFSRLRAAARLIGEELLAGVYAQVTGPCYETKAEIRALRQCGADAVGMSTAREIEAGAALGMQCAALSCITNRAAGLCAGPISHEEVLACGKLCEEHLRRLLETFLATLDRPLTRWVDKPAADLAS